MSNKTANKLFYAVYVPIIPALMYAADVSAQTLLSWL